MLETGGQIPLTRQLRFETDDEHRSAAAASDSAVALLALAHHMAKGG